MFGTLSDKNIPQIKAVIKKFGKCWFHGCGNIYIDKGASDFRQRFTNPNMEESIYRVEFSSIDQVPATVEELVKKLLTSRNEEMVRDKMNKVSKGIATIEVEEETTAPAPGPSIPQTGEKTAEEIEFERLLAEENANKSK